MNSPNAQWTGFDEIPPLPSCVTIRGGAKIDPRGDIWSFTQKAQAYSINFGRLPHCSDRFIGCFKHTLLWYLKNRSADYAFFLFEQTRCFLRSVDDSRAAGLGQIEHVTSIDILNYKATLDKRNEWYLRSAGIFLRKWHELGYPGIDRSAITALGELALAPNLKGEAVLTWDPYVGPFTELEFEGIQNALNAAYANVDISTSEYVLAWLFMTLGARPVQFSTMKVCDFSASPNDAGGIDYSLKVPRGKQRDDIDGRSEFKDRLLNSQVGRLVEQYVDEVKQEARELMDNPSQAPMYPKWTRKCSGDGYDFHCSSDDISTMLDDAMAQLDVCSERTGEQINIIAYRFRRTLGTRAAAEGHGPLIIAELLDHSSTQNVGVYVQATPQLMERIDKEMALKLAPLAKNFCGRLIRDEAEATRGDDPSSRIIDLRIDETMRPMGSCGNYDFCGFLAPIACYPCPHFEPWWDGPHEAVLDFLLAERERLGVVTDERIAKINDLAIIACAEVVQRIKDLNDENEGGSDV